MTSLRCIDQNMIIHGTPLTPDEANHVVNRLSDRIRASALQRCASCFVYSEAVNDVLKHLGWPQRRLPDLRTFLESKTGYEQLQASLDWPLTQHNFVTRYAVTVHISLDAPINHHLNTQLRIAEEQAQRAASRDRIRTKDLPELLSRAVYAGMTSDEVLQDVGVWLAKHAK